MFYLEITQQDGAPTRVPFPQFMTFPEMQGSIRARVMEGAKKAAIISEQEGHAQEVWAWTQAAWEGEQLDHKMRVEMAARHVEMAMKQSQTLTRRR